MKTFDKLGIGRKFSIINQELRRAFDTSINQKVLQSLITGLFFCQLFCFIV